MLGLMMKECHPGSSSRRPTKDGQGKEDLFRYSPSVFYGAPLIPPINDKGRHINDGGQYQYYGSSPFRNVVMLF